MDSRYNSVVSILLLSFISITVSETGYQVIFSREDEVVTNTFTLKCQNTSTGLGLSNAKWFFNSTDYSSNPCTQDAMISGGMMDELVLTLVPECEGYMQCGTDTVLSPSKLLLTYPTPIPDTNLAQQTVYLQTGESIVIPCGIRVSATGNFEAEWTKEGGTIMNVTLDSKYGLILENVPVTDSGIVYCKVSAVTGDNLNPSDDFYHTIYGRTTLLVVTTYIQPKIIDELQIIRSGNRIKFISSAVASDVDEYQWLKNNIEIRDSINVTIDNIPQENNVIEGTLEFNSFNELNDGDVIKAVINNTNIYGQTMEDSDRAVLFTVPPSTCITTNEGTSMTMSNTVTVTVECDPISNPFKPGTTPGMTNIILLVITVVLIILFLVFLILKHHYKCINKQPRSIESDNGKTNQTSQHPESNETPRPDHNNQHSEIDDTTSRSDQTSQHPEINNTTPRSKPHNQHSENDILQIHVGSQTFEIPKNDVSLTDLLKKFNAIILLADLHIDKSNTEVKDVIVQLRLTITEWEKNAKLVKTDEQNVTKDNIQLDSRSTWFDEMLPALMNLINE